MTKKKLTAREKRFIEEYPIDLNGAEAYVRAGYSPKGANAGAARLLARVSIRTEIDKRLAKRSEKAEISQEWVLEQLKTNLARSHALDQMPPANRAVELLGKHLGMFTDKVEHSGKIGGSMSKLETARWIAALLSEGAKEVDGTG